MKTYPLTFLVFCLAAALPAQTPAPVADGNRTPDELDQLAAPIALYPDALVALILPAATVPTDIVRATRFLTANDPLANVDVQPWDESVRALAHYPDIVKWMDANFEWTLALGAAFMQQPADVMQAIQRLRAKARADGALIDTPQQQIVVDDDGAICIEPVQPDVIYVPIYDPELVFWGQEPLLGRPYLTFGLGYSIGVWLNFDCDWHHHNVWVRQHPRDWDRRREPGRPPAFWRPDNDGHAWQPPPLGRPRFNVPVPADRQHGAIPRPRPMPEVPGDRDRPRPPFNAESDSRRPDGRDQAPVPNNRSSSPQIIVPAPGQRPVPPPAAQGGPRRDGSDRPDAIPGATDDRPRPARNPETDSHRPVESDRAPVQAANRPSPPQVNAPAPGQSQFAPRGDVRRDGEDRAGPERRTPSAPPAPPPPPVTRPAAPPPPPPPPPPAASQAKNAPSTNANEQ